MTVKQVSYHNDKRSTFAFSTTHNVALEQIQADIWV